MKKSSNVFRKSAAWAMVVGASSVLGGCSGETPEMKSEATPSPAAAAPAPPKHLSAAEKAALRKKQLTEDEPSAQERRKARLQAKKAE